MIWRDKEKKKKINKKEKTQTIKNKKQLTKQTKKSQNLRKRKRTPIHEKDQEIINVINSESDKRSLFD